MKGKPPLNPWTAITKTQRKAFMAAMPFLLAFQKYPIEQQNQTIEDFSTRGPKGRWFARFLVRVQRYGIPGSIRREYQNREVSEIAPPGLVRQPIVENIPLRALMDVPGRKLSPEQLGQVERFVLENAFISGVLPSPAVAEAYRRRAYEAERAWVSISEVRKARKKAQNSLELVEKIKERMANDRKTPIGLLEAMLTHELQQAERNVADFLNAVNYHWNVLIRHDVVLRGNKELQALARRIGKDAVEPLATLSGSRKWRQAVSRHVEHRIRNELVLPVIQGDIPTYREADRRLLNIIADGLEHVNASRQVPYIILEAAGLTKYSGLPSYWKKMGREARMDKLAIEAIPLLRRMANAKREPDFMEAQKKLLSLTHERYGRIGRLSKAMAPEKKLEEHWIHPAYDIASRSPSKGGIGLGSALVRALADSTTLSAMLHGEYGIADPRATVRLGHFLGLPEGGWPTMRAIRRYWVSEHVETSRWLRKQLLDDLKRLNPSEELMKRLAGEDPRGMNVLMSPSGVRKDLYLDTIDAVREVFKLEGTRIRQMKGYSPETGDRYARLQMLLDRLDYSERIYTDPEKRSPAAVIMERELHKYFDSRAARRWAIDMLRHYKGEKEILKAAEQRLRARFDPRMPESMKLLPPEPPGRRDAAGTLIPRSEIEVGGVVYNVENPGTPNPLFNLVIRQMHSNWVHNVVKLKNQARDNELNISNMPWTAYTTSRGVRYPVRVPTEKEAMALRQNLGLLSPESRRQLEAADPGFLRFLDLVTSPDSRQRTHAIMELGGQYAGMDDWRGEFMKMFFSWSTLPSQMNPTTPLRRRGTPVNVDVLPQGLTNLIRFQTMYPDAGRPR